MMFCEACNAAWHISDGYECRSEYGGRARSVEFLTQSARHSALESAFNTATGFCLSFIGGEVVFPLIGAQVSHTQNLTIVSVLTVVSFVRGYLVRRLFNWLHRKGRL
jgi:hypothetical protein